jgi:hypothetical protein
MKLRETSLRTTARTRAKARTKVRTKVRTKAEADSSAPLRNDKQRSQAAITIQNNLDGDYDDD